MSYQILCTHAAFNWLELQSVVIFKPWSSHMTDGWRNTTTIRGTGYPSF
ncbi:1031_t:CDS:2 [Funneliformis mosseae]|uniref:1031_t:CDS:1 n=1 Tax=Funneliformis mosseae TaxID=27381 RepID=A0A9N8Z861_FUNMO|nr:1031_t:CDS:2 [Funneliformis mosseae]